MDKSRHLSSRAIHHRTNTKHNFENLFFSLCASNSILPIPSIKILSSQPKLGEKWRTYVFHEDPELTYFDIYIQYENYAKDGIIKKVIFRNHKISNDILNCLEQSIQSFQTITTLKFYNCRLTPLEVPTLYVILRTFENIIDLSFDGNPLHKPVFFLLLKDNNLKYLSMQHCKINANAVKEISDEVKTNNKLIFLDLSCNNIGDAGMKYLSEAIRQNRSIVSLILVDNNFSDEGVSHLMRALSCFELNIDEIAIRRQIRFKLELAKMEKAKLQLQRRTAPVKQSPVSPRTKKRRGKENKAFSATAHKKMTKNVKRTSLHGSEPIPDHEYHPFVDDAVPESGEIFCKGNNKLAYINMAYNKITEDGFKFIEDTLRYQINLFKPQEGLIDLILTGNRVKEPEYYNDIQKLLEYKKAFEIELDMRNTRKSI